ncbi:MAG: hypothetical protein A3F73_11305 [Gallionellales bacterium RIFCSPLOWO2_12_FULL_59_22]|nr:MAG: hypothetical protein A3H99_11000 [Gallionellales bacterium RIFCSPLOWO2_02_FULL_59_110]OGT04496.1 MAG: hypothetical protein A2Z65_02900 [Gallionellales bacterium RIFCSPLOWO2_02_58_13]OGT13502.1 MAG: hypothetical protein A3F73_11305 [Gallionellales bacterium RIFCSPLOWO2_12_FULL_59_22]
MKIYVCATLMCLALLSGCSTLSEQECRSEDWHRLGVKDGQHGGPASLLDEHQESCSRYGIRPDEDQYLAGRDAGLMDYCQLGNAFRTGMNGEKYQGVCALDVDAEFRRYNSAALEVYNSKKQAEDIDSQISRKEKELGKKGASEKEKLRLLEEIRQLDRKRDRLRSDLHYQERELDRLMDKAKHRDVRR